MNADRISKMKSFICTLFLLAMIAVPSVSAETEGFLQKKTVLPREAKVSKKILKENSEEPCGKNRRVSEIEYLFSLSFLLAGNPSDLFEIARKILDKPE